jgi:hypothetical protein
MSESLLIAGAEVPCPGLEVRRDPRAWWDADHPSCEPRSGAIGLLCWHWTAGEGGLASYDDDGPRVVGAMKARRHVDGSPMRVSIGFVLGACAEGDALAPLWQSMDIALATGIHAGRAFSRRSIGVEVVSAGISGTPLDTRHRPSRVVYVAGRRVKLAAFYPGQMRTMALLAAALSSSDLDTPLGRALRAARIEIPAQVPARGGELYLDRMTQRQARTWRGGVEHLHSPSTTKVDAGGQGLEACELAGWRRVEV